MTSLKVKYTDHSGNQSIREVSEIYVGKKYDDRQPAGSKAKKGKEVTEIYQVVSDEYSTKKLVLIWSSYINILLKTENTDEDVFDETKNSWMNIEDDMFAVVDEHSGNVDYI